MVVSLTPNIGLSMPDDTELAKNWTTGPNLNSANNAIIVDKTDINFNAFGATIVGKTSNPNLGSGGGIRFDYQEFQGYVWGTFVVLFNDPGVSAGVGEYGISLPYVADSSYYTVGTALDFIPGFNSVIGEGYAQDVSTVANSGLCAVDICTVGGVSYARLATQTYTGKTGRCIGGGTGPFTVATGDRLTGSFFYKHV